MMNEKRREKKTGKHARLAVDSVCFAQEKLRESEERSRLIFEEAPVGIVLVGRDCRFLKANAAFCRIVGYTEQELRKLAFTDITHPDHVQKDMENAQKLIRGASSRYYTEKRYIRKDGQIVWASATVSTAHDANGTLLYLLAIIENITERRRAEEALRESEERYRSIYENAPFGIYHATVEGKLVDANFMFARIMGYSSSEEIIDAVNKSSLAECIYVKPELRASYIREVLARGGWHEYESLYRRKDGRTITGWLRSREMPRVDSTGAELEGFIEDISAKKKAEEELLVYQDKLRLLSSQLAFVEEKERLRLANNIHDYVGQALACAMLKLRSLENEATLSPGVRDGLREVRGQVEQSIKNARSITFELSPSILYKLGFEAVVEWLADYLQEHHGISCHVKSDSSLKIRDDEVRVILFRAVREVLMNVVKHAKARHVYLSLRKTKGLLKISVRDDGVGFDVARASKKKRGFGIFSVREQMACIGGSISIASRRGKGTCVTIVAPLNGSRAAGEKAEEEGHDDTIEGSHRYRR